MISVVIPCTPQEHLLIEKALDSLALQTGLSLEVILVMNPKFNLETRRWPQLSLAVIESPIGANHARNVGLLRAKYDFVYFLDADCALADSKQLLRLVRFLESHPDATAVGGKYSLPPDANLDQQAYHWIQEEWLLSGLKSNQWETHYLLGGNCLFDRSKLKSIQFDETMIYGGTEVELFIRLGQLGHRFYLSKDLAVFHFAPINPSSLRKKAIKQAQGSEYINEKLQFRHIRFKFRSTQNLPSDLSSRIEAYHRVFQREKDPQNCKKYLGRFFIFSSLDFITKSFDIYSWKFKIDQSKCPITSKTSESGFSS